MTRDEMIEAGARAIDPDAWTDNYATRSICELRRRTSLRESERVLLATVPGIMAGTHAELALDTQVWFGIKPTRYDDETGNGW